MVSYRRSDSLDSDQLRQRYAVIVVGMKHLTAAIVEAMEQAAISGLCREGQLEIAVQEARKVRPDLSDDELLELAKAVHGLSRSGI